MATKILTVEELSKMDRGSLLELQANVEQALAVTEAAAKEEAKEKMLELAKASGFDITELFGAKVQAKGGNTGGRKGRTISPKYRNPETGETWTGMGRHPKFIKDFTLSGGNLEDWLIEKP